MIIESDLLNRWGSRRVVKCMRPRKLVFNSSVVLFQSLAENVVK